MGTSLAKSIVAAVLTVMLGGPAMATNALPEQPAAVHQTTTAKVATAQTVTTSDASRYAARQQSAQKLEHFKGGAAIYIGVSAIALAALIVLLLVLI
jgi:hypothetical protein